MESPQKKIEQLSPEREALEIEFRKVEIDQKVQDLSSGKIIDELEIEKRKLANDQIKIESSLDYLIAISKISIVDNEKTQFSDPVFKSIWDDQEIEEIKSLIMKKLKKI